MNKRLIVVSLIIMLILSYSVIGQAKDSTPQFTYTHIGTLDYGQNDSDQYDWYVGTHKNIVISADGTIIYHIFSYSKGSVIKVCHYYIYDYKTQKISNNLSGMEFIDQPGGTYYNANDNAEWINVGDFGHYDPWIPDKLAFRTVIDFLKHNLEDVADFREDKSVPIPLPE